MLLLLELKSERLLGGFPIINIPAMERTGMRLSLGCDGSATNDSSNLLDSLRMAYLMQSFYSKQRGGAPSAYDLLKTAVRGGADILGRKDIGSIETGKGCDLFMVDTEKLELAGTLHDPANLIARTGITGPVWLTMINGKVVYREGRLYGIDERETAKKAENSCTDIISNKLTSRTSGM